MANRRSIWFILFGAALWALVAASLACAAEKGATPAPTVAPKATAAPAPTTAAAPTAAPVAKPVYGGNLRTAMSITIKSLDPLHFVDFRDQYANYAIYDNLVETDENFNLVPGLASSWKISSDGKTVTFNLLKGVKFHDGTDFNAQAVKWNYEKMIDKDFGSSFGYTSFGPVIESIEALDNNTVAFHLKKPYRPLIGHMTLALVRIISPTAYEKSGRSQFAGSPVGTGAFKLKEWAPDRHIILEKFDGYWEKGKPYLDAITIQNVPERSTQGAMLRTGETDLLEDVRGPEVPLLEGQPIIKIVPYPSSRWWSLTMNTTFELFTSKPLRQAIAYAINRQKVVEVHLQGSGRPAYLNGAGWYRDPDFKLYEYNLQKSKEKLAEAGLASGISFDYYCEGIEIQQRLCEVIQAMLKEAGINTNIKPVLASDWGKFRAEGKMSFGQYGWYPRPDPDLVMRATLHCEGNTAKVLARYCNPEASKLVDDAAGVYDTTVAGPMYLKAQKLVMEDVPYVSLYNEYVFAGLNKKVGGWVWIPDTFPRYRTLWLEK